MYPVADIIEDLGNDITRKWLHEGRIVVYEVLSVSRLAIDTWASAVLTDTQNWPDDRPMLALHDFSRVGLTPYGRRRAEDTARQIPSHIVGRYAVVVSSGVFGTAVRVFAQGRINQLIPHMESAFFFDQQAALDWLTA